MPAAAATAPRCGSCASSYAACPAGIPEDPGYRRLRYVRYADDHLLGFTGPKAEAEQIKARLTPFLRDDLKLELSQDKTLITHARTGAARFLGYEITVQHADHKITGGRGINGAIGLRVPTDVIKAKCAPYLKRGKPAPRTHLVNDDDHTIIATYGAEYRGLVNYYLLAGDVWRLNRLRWVMETSMLKTLACKHRSSVSKMAPATRPPSHTARAAHVLAGQRRTRRQDTVDRTFGGIPLKRQKKAVLTDRQPAPVTVRRKELIDRLLAGRCELCDTPARWKFTTSASSPTSPSRGSHSRHGHNSWPKRRKTLVVCAACHATIHARQPPRPHTE